MLKKELTLDFSTMVTIQLFKNGMDLGPAPVVLGALEHYPDDALFPLSSGKGSFEVPAKLLREKLQNKNPSLDIELDLAPPAPESKANSSELKDDAKPNTNPAMRLPPEVAQEVARLSFTSRDYDEMKSLLDNFFGFKSDHRYLFIGHNDGEWMCVDLNESHRNKLLKHGIYCKENELQYPNTKISPSDLFLVLKMGIKKDPIKIKNDSQKKSSHAKVSHDLNKAPNANGSESKDAPAEQPSGKLSKSALKKLKLQESKAKNKDIKNAKKEKDDKAARDKAKAAKQAEIKDGANHEMKNVPPNQMGQLRLFKEQPMSPDTAHPPVPRQAAPRGTPPGGAPF
jgi:hypothetical protein